MDKRVIFLCVLLISHSVLSEDFPQLGSSEDKEPDDLSYDVLKVDEDEFDDNDDLNDPLEAMEADYQLEPLQNPGEVDEDASTMARMFPGLKRLAARQRKHHFHLRRLVRKLRKMGRLRSAMNLKLARHFLRRSRRSKRSRRRSRRRFRRG